MEFNRNAEVFTKDNHKVGTVSRVVIDPKTNEVTHLVVEKGFLFTTDRVFPINMVGPSTEERITLCVDESELDELPEFEETFYVPRQAEGLVEGQGTKKSQRLFMNPPYGYTYWNQGIYPLPPYVLHTERFIPEGTVPLKEGAEVISSDDHNIGHVEALLTDPVENRITHMVVSKGFIFEDKKLIPSIWISLVMENEIHLLVDAKVIEALPDYEPATS